MSASQATQLDALFKVLEVGASSITKSILVR